MGKWSNPLTQQIELAKRRREAGNARKDERRERAGGEWDAAAPTEPLCCYSCGKVFDLGFDLLSCPECGGDVAGLSLARTASSKQPAFTLDGYTVGMSLFGLACFVFLVLPRLVRFVL